MYSGIGWRQGEGHAPRGIGFNRLLQIEEIDQKFVLFAVGRDVVQDAIGNGVARDGKYRTVLEVQQRFTLQLGADAARRQIFPRQTRD